MRQTHESETKDIYWKCSIFVIAVLDSISRQASNIPATIVNYARTISRHHTTQHIVFVSNAHNTWISGAEVSHVCVCVLWCISKTIIMASSNIPHLTFPFRICKTMQSLCFMNLCLSGFWVYLHRLPGVGCQLCACDTKKRLSKYMPLKHSIWIEINGLGTTVRYKRNDFKSRWQSAHSPEPTPFTLIRIVQMYNSLPTSDTGQNCSIFHRTFMPHVHTGRWT